jgi:hypothetical protein
MLTQDDIIKMKEVFATKQDLADLREDLTEKMATKEQFNQVMNGVDTVIGELKAFREEQAAHFLKHEEIDQDLAAIKAIPAIAHELKRK